MIDLAAEERLAIQDLIARYAFFTDQYQGEAWSQLFLEEGVLEGLPEPLVGREALAAKNVELKEGPTEYRHFITNLYLESGAADRAVARAYGLVLDWALRPPSLAMFVEYRFDLVKRGGQWKIARVVVIRPYEGNGEGAR
ncbi:MAG: hypothetical protein KatS3mg124_1069 [Porticoccaceae bacterium]|nr:MAG: hypothetical protein KatS3mg124_1069 [Porticoccaceae bacterium]